MKNLSLAVALFICVVSLPVISQQGSNNDRQQQLREQMRSTLQSVRTGVKNSEDNLDARVRAHKSLAGELGNNMPPDLVDGLSRELKILQLLEADNSQALRPLITIETSLVNGDGQVSMADGAKAIDQVNETFGMIQKVLESKHDSRQEFKKRLNRVIDSLIAARPEKMNLYVWIKTQLNPDILDLEFASQKTMLASLVVVFNLLKR